MSALVIILVLTIFGYVVGMTSSHNIDNRNRATMRDVRQSRLLDIVPAVWYFLAGQVVANVAINNLPYLAGTGFWKHILLGLVLSFLLVAGLIAGRVIRHVPVEHRMVHYCMGRYFRTVGNDGGLFGRFFSPLIPGLFTLTDNDEPGDVVDMRPKIEEHKIGRKDNGVPFVGSVKGTYFKLLINGMSFSVLRRLHGSGNFRQDYVNLIIGLGTDIAVQLDRHQLLRLSHYLRAIDINSRARNAFQTATLNDTRFVGTAEEETLINNTLLPLIRAFVVACRDDLGYLVLGLAAKDVDIVDKKTEESIEDALRAPLDRDARVTRAAATRAEEQAKVQGYVDALAAHLPPGSLSPAHVVQLAKYLAAKDGANLTLQEFMVDPQIAGLLQGVDLAAVVAAVQAQRAAGNRGGQGGGNRGGGRP